MAKPVSNDGISRNVVHLELTDPQGNKHIYRATGLSGNRPVNSAVHNDADGLPDGVVRTAGLYTGSANFRGRKDGREPQAGDRFVHPYKGAAAKASVQIGNLIITAPTAGIFGNKYSFSTVAGAAVEIDFATAGNHAILGYEDGVTDEAALKAAIEAHEFLGGNGFTVAYDGAADGTDLVGVVAETAMSGGENNQMEVTNVNDGDDGEFNLRAYDVSFEEVMVPDVD